MRCLFTFALLALPSFVHAEEITVVVGKEAIEFKSGSAVVAKYATASTNAKPFLYPVLAPNGTPVTRGWPMEMGLPGEATKDHIHQKSVWFTHGDVIPEGIELKTKHPNKNDKGVDFWSETKDKDGKPRHGRIAVVKVGEPKKTDRGIRIETQNEWFTPDDVKIMDETRVLTFSETAEGRLFVFEITLKATVCPITFGDTKEGSFGIRTHDALRPSEKDGATVTTGSNEAVVPPKKDNLPIWGHPTPWIDYSGKVNGKEVGIAVFEGPSNTPKASWHVRAYGLNAANPFGRAGSGFPSQKGNTTLLKLDKGGELKLKYAVYAHNGDVKTGKVAEAFEAFKK